MITRLLREGFLSVIFLLATLISAAQPTLPDLTGSNENGLALLSWTCQYDGVKSISVLRSADSNFNYSTIGYVKKLYKGVQGYIDGHPYAGKNFYKLSIVFNSGLTWTSNHYGVDIDEASIKNRRNLPSNEALQKLLVTDIAEKATKDDKVKKKTVAQADRDRYMEVLKKEPEAVADKEVRPKFKLKNDETAIDPLLETMPESSRKKMSITYSNDNEEVNAGQYIKEEHKTAEAPRKKVSITFDDKEDISTFIETMPKEPGRKITLSYNQESGDLNPESYIDEKKNAAPKKKITLTFKNEEEVQAYVETLPKAAKNKITMSYNIDSIIGNATPEPPKVKLSIRFTDDLSSTNASNSIKSKFVTTDPVSGNVIIGLPDDIATHHYSIKFFDKDNRMVIEVPKLNMGQIVMDRRNFQKKGQYKFTIRKDVLELESGYISIY